MELTVCVANPAHLEDCKAALLGSEIGEMYFTPERATSFISDGISKGEIYVALGTDSICCGYIWFTLDGTFYSFPYVRNLMVKSEFRGQGVGKVLLDYFEQVSFLKSGKVFLLVSEHNSRAKKFYERHGYQEVGFIPDLIREGLSEYLMMKSRPSCEEI